MIDASPPGKERREKTEVQSSIHDVGRHHKRTDPSTRIPTFEKVKQSIIQILTCMVYGSTVWYLKNQSHMLCSISSLPSLSDDIVTSQSPGFPYLDKASVLYIQYGSNDSTRCSPVSQEKGLFGNLEKHSNNNHQTKP